MGVTYKLKDEIVHFIVQQRQENPRLSCREAAELVEAKFHIHISKSSVHDVLKQANVETPRGRKPKADNFKIPTIKKEQIKEQVVKQLGLLPDPLPVTVEKLVEPPQESFQPMQSQEPAMPLLPDISPMLPMIQAEIPQEEPIMEPVPEIVEKEVSPALERSAGYDQAGEIFLKAALWDLGIFSVEGVRDIDWDYYLTYAAGIKVLLEEGSIYLISSALPLQRCIMEAVDGIINNIHPLMVHQVSDEELLKASMVPEPGKRIKEISIVDGKNHIIANFDDIMDQNRSFEIRNRNVVVSNEKDMPFRTKALFFSQDIDIKEITEKVSILRGFDIFNAESIQVHLWLKEDEFFRKTVQDAADRVNASFIRDSKGRLLEIIVEGEE